MTSVDGRAVAAADAEAASRLRRAQKWMRPARRGGVLAILIAAGLVLSACTAVHQFALRLNADGTFDFGTCDEFATVTSMTAQTYMRTGSTEADRDLEVEPVPTEMREGDVIHLGSAASDHWDQLHVEIDGTVERGGESIEIQRWGLFNRADLVVGEWSWQRSGAFIGTVPVEGCELSH